MMNQMKQNGGGGGMPGMPSMDDSDFMSPEQKAKMHEEKNLQRKLKKLKKKRR